LKPVDSVTRGTFLVASPLLRDPNFLRTVVLMCEHGDGGSWGVVVNRPTELALGDLVDGMPVPSAVPGVVHWGGPVETSRLQVLHRLRSGAEGELEICPGVSLGLDLEELREVTSRPLLPGEALHAYVGHAGWAGGQLDAELDTGSWIMCTGNQRFVFDTRPEEIWDRVLLALGPRFASLTRVPLDPRLN
jgi:putative transcriptional regulator